MAVEVNLTVLDELDGEPGIDIGEQFEISVSFLDVRPSTDSSLVRIGFQDIAGNLPAISGYADFTFDPNFFRVDGITFSDFYNFIDPDGDGDVLTNIDNSSGEINEVGAFIGSASDPGTFRALLGIGLISLQSFTISLTAIAAGVSTFGSNAGEDTFSEIVVIGSDDDQRSNTLFKEVSITVECFLAGTYILTEHGEVRVEKLRIGDKVQTADGTLSPIKWIGRQTCSPHNVRNPLRSYPILVKAGALGNNLPYRDLWVSPDHALFVEGLLINAGALVNDISIFKTEPTETFTYYHIELKKHALLMVEGISAESYLPQKEDRLVYDNGAEYEELYPHDSKIILWPLDYPRVSSFTSVPRYIRKHLKAIALEIQSVEQVA